MNWCKLFGFLSHEPIEDSYPVMGEKRICKKCGEEIQAVYDGEEGQYIWRIPKVKPKEVAGQ